MASLDGDRRELLEAVRGRLAAAVKGRLAAPVERVESGGWGFRNAYPRELLALPRQIRLPGPLPEDLREVRRAPVNEQEFRGLAPLSESLEKAELLRLVRDGGRTKSVLERDTVMKTYQEVIAQLVHTLSDFSYSKLDISDGVRDQVELVHAQLQRAKERVDMPDDKEYTALHKMMASYGGQDSQKYSEKMSVLKKIEDLVLAKNSDMGPPTASKLMDSSRDGSETIPEEFRNPKPLGQTKHAGQIYASACIEECLASGHQIHESTLQRTPNAMSTPNYASSYSTTDCVNIDALLTKLCSPDPVEQKSAVAELRLLAKQNASNRFCIAEAGAIPLLLNLLSSSDLQTQAHAITALLNLSIHVDNKERIISSGAVPSIVHVLMNGNMEARENAAATLLSLSVMDEYKVTIGETGAIPALVVLLSEGSQRGKKDAAHALFNLCTYEGNKAHAVRAGLVSLIMGLLTQGALMDEATAILPVLSSHPEGKAAIGAGEPVHILVEMISSESRRNSECAAEVLLHLCSDEQKLKQLAYLPECRIMVPLGKLALNGSGRGKRKAVQLLERISRFLVDQQEEHEVKL